MLFFKKILRKFSFLNFIILVLFFFFWQGIGVAKIGILGMHMVYKFLMARS